MAPVWKQTGRWGAVLAAGMLALQWLDYQWMARSDARELLLALVGGGFLVIGLILGARLFAPPRPLPFDGNRAALVALGISPRELTVLERLAAGLSNQEIAAELHVSPNTVKTHVSRLFEKLGARRRTDAIARARELGLIP